MSQKLFIKGGTLANGTKADISITDGVIASIATLPSAPDGAQVIDAKDCIILPGLVDLHTHLREPGKESAETVLSGSKAAAKGGYVAVSAMANTTPVADNASVVEHVYRLGQKVGIVDVFPVGAVTQGLAGENLADIGAMANSEARVRVFSDDGNCVSDALVMRHALEYVKGFDGVIAQHAQEPRLTQGAQMNEGIVSSQLGLKGWPAIAEEAIIARDILLADFLQARLHICHVTTAGGVEIIRWAKARGIAVTAEVTPHHLLLTDELARSYDAVYKVNPPLRTEKDVMALREGLAQGIIDIVATDHAPHATESKECEWQEAAFGMLGLETALPIVNQTMVQTGLMSWEQVAARMSSAPAQIARYENHGHEIAVGAKAHITVINPTATHRVDRDLVLSRSRNTPFHGLELPGVIMATVFGGKLTYEGSK
ncbi:PyrC Dihydroorotase and related cyclic amidohydrolases [Candidatus Planktophila versatilis]|uniref:dihydroorotase n=1 Tax=Candidatus Planktophila versatilis TaxID=1884905 RepID=UPI003BEF42F0